MTPRSEFVYLSEQDTVAAGVLDAARCVDVCEEVFELLATGDYLMGGATGNSHGLGLVFPATSPFPGMPTAGPDRRFVTMPAYLGGRFDVCGNKLYGSNPRNPENGLPRSVLTVMLNDKDTGEPLTLMSANLLSAARTGAVPAVAARHLASPTATTLAVIGCGVINRAVVTAVLTQCPGITEIVCFNRSDPKAVAFAEWARSTFGVGARVVTSARECVATADVVTVAASRTAPLEVDSSWFPETCTVLLSGPMGADEEFWTGSRIVYDSIPLHQAYVEEAVNSPDTQAGYDAVIGGPLYRLVDAGKLPALTDSLDLGTLILERRVDPAPPPPGRTVFVACGMAVFDVAWGHEVYRSALDQGLGRRLSLWETPVTA